MIIYNLYIYCIYIIHWTWTCSWTFELNLNWTWTWLKSSILNLNWTFFKKSSSSSSVQFWTELELGQKFSSVQFIGTLLVFRSSVQFNLGSGSSSIEPELNFKFCRSLNLNLNWTLNLWTWTEPELKVLVQFKFSSSSWTCSSLMNYIYILYVIK